MTDKNKEIVRGIYNDISTAYDKFQDWLDHTFDTGVEQITSMKLKKVMDDVRWGLETARDNIGTEFDNLEKVLGINQEEK